MAIISLKDITFAYINLPVLQNISIDIEEGEILQLIGEHGCGKTTLIKIAASLLPPTKGNVNILGENPNEISYSELKKLRKKIGYVHQTSTNIANMTIFDNVALPLRYHRILKESEIKNKVEEILNQLNILEYANERPIKLPEKYRRKIDLARALVIEPWILFLDAPFREFSLKEQLNLLEIIKGFYEKNRLTIIIVENNKILLRGFSKKVAVMRKGKIINICKPTEILNSKDEYINGIL